MVSLVDSFTNNFRQSLAPVICMLVIVANSTTAASTEVLKQWPSRACRLCGCSDVQITVHGPAELLQWSEEFASRDGTWRYTIYFIMHQRYSTTVVIPAFI